MTAVIKIKSLTKSFADNVAVDSLSLNVPEGSVYGFLGSNGAGKTTTIRMLMGHLHPTSGEVEVFGKNPWHHDAGTLQRVAYVSSDMAVPGWMTTEKLIAMGQRLFPEWDAGLAQTLTKQFQLEPRKRYSRSSTGQRRKMLILSALCQTADLLILDEPAMGLDVESRNILLSQILEVACDEGRSVILSSHLLSDVERVVDRVAVLREGKLVCDEELDVLKSSVRQLQIAEQISEEALSKHFDVLSCEITTWGTRAIVAACSEDTLSRLASELAQPESLRSHSLNLEDLYLQFTGQPVTHCGSGLSETTS